MSARRLRALLWLNVVPQAVLGVGVFAIAPDAVFPGIDATGALALRIAAFSNVAQVILTATALRRREDLALQRVMVLAFGLYHALALAQSGLIAFVLPLSALSEACRGPAGFHAVMATLLLVGGWARPPAREPPC